MLTRWNTISMITKQKNKCTVGSWSLSLVSVHDHCQPIPQYAPSNSSFWKLLLLFCACHALAVPSFVEVHFCTSRLHKRSGWSEVVSTAHIHMSHVTSWVIPNSSLITLTVGEINPGQSMVRHWNIPKAFEDESFIFLTAGQPCFVICLWNFSAFGASLVYKAFDVTTAWVVSSQFDHAYVVQE